MNTADAHNFDEGLIAYKKRDFEYAISLLKAVVEQDPYDWQAKFYLAMSLAQADHPREARYHFLSIRDQCPNPEMRQRADSAAAALSSMLTKRTS